MDAYDVFYEEVTKSAATARALTRAARWLTDSPARTALVGAGVGAAQGALTAGDEGVGSAALRGGLRGAAVGGAAGGLGRAYRDTRLLNPALSGGAAVGETAKRLGESVKRFGQRQLHGLTGAYTDDAARIGLRSTGEAERRMHLEILRAGDKNRHGELSDKAIKKLVNRHRDLREWGQTGDAALNAGITSLPGVAKGLATKPVTTAKALGRNMLDGGGTGGAAMALGVPLAIAAPDLARGDESVVGGRSMRQKIVGAGSGIAGGVLTAGMPLVPNLVGGVAVDAAASRILGGSKKRLARAQQEAGQQAIIGAVAPGGA
jgi:hypothetical protein